MAEATKPPRKKKGEGVPPPLPTLNLNIDKKLVMIGRTPLNAADAKSYGEKIVKLSEVLEKL